MKMQTRSQTKLRTAFGTTLIVALAQGSLAGDSTWTGLGDGTTFGLGANWDLLLAPGFEDYAIFDDDGGGIPPEIVERIFDPFFTTKEAGDGTGLGLYIAYEIVRIHEGSIRVDPKYGEGARFEVRLPLTKPEGSGDTG